MVNHRLHQMKEHVLVHQHISWPYRMDKKVRFINTCIIYCIKEFSLIVSLNSSWAQRTAASVVYILLVEMVQQKRILIPFLLQQVNKGHVNPVILLYHCFLFEINMYTMPRCYNSIIKRWHLRNKKQTKRGARKFTLNDQWQKPF